MEKKVSALTKKLSAIDIAAKQIQDMVAA